MSKHHADYDRQIKTAVGFSKVHGLSESSPTQSFGVQVLIFEIWMRLRRGIAKFGSAGPEKPVRLCRILHKSVCQVCGNQTAAQSN